MKKCLYLTEGECEEKLINALKESPSLVIPGRVKIFNVIQNELPRSVLMQFDPGSLVVLVFDTDKDITEHLRNNLRMLQNLSFKVSVLTIPQVKNFEDEVERATNVTKAIDLTKSRSVDDFKSAVNKMKARDFRNTLLRHKLDMMKLWAKQAPKSFAFVKQDAAEIKI